METETTRAQEEILQREAENDDWAVFGLLFYGVIAALGITFGPAYIANSLNPTPSPSPEPTPTTLVSPSPSPSVDIYVAPVISPKKS